MRKTNAQLVLDYIMSSIKDKENHENINGILVTEVENKQRLVRTDGQQMIVATGFDTGLKPGLYKKSSKYTIPVDSKDYPSYEKVVLESKTAQVYYEKIETLNDNDCTFANILKKLVENISIESSTRLVWIDKFLELADNLHVSAVRKTCTFYIRQYDLIQLQILTEYGQSSLLFVCRLA